MKPAKDPETLTKESRANTQEFLRTSPLAALKAKLDTLEKHDYAGVLDAALPLARDTSWFTDRVDEWMARIVADPSFLPPVFGIQDHGLDFEDSGIMLFMHPLLNVSVASLFPRARSAKIATELVFTGRPSIAAFMGTGAATLKWWSCTRLDDRADIARAVKIEPGAEQRVDASSPPIEQDGAVAAFEFAEIDGSLSLMRFAARNGPCPVSVRYNPSTSAISAVAPNLRADARLIMSAAVLRNLQRPERAEALRTQLDHPSFFVRWQLMREYISAVGTEAIPDLTAFLAREQNPSVQRSAEATLKMLQDAAAKNAAAP